MYELQIFTEENALDLHDVGGIPYHSRRQYGGKKIQILQKHKCPCHSWFYFQWLSFVSCFVCSKPKVNFIHSSSQTQHYRKSI